jgi:hypothetical protein
MVAKQVESIFGLRRVVSSKVIIIKTIGYNFTIYLAAYLMHPMLILLRLSRLAGEAIANY